ncbi:coproporphyrinogen dehydrogenase HemZ [Alicyclobacillus tolerans]|uniref:Oxygen-independent coproporphyrinogen-3 oxidase n=1 Tax=Alicyclobacillus tolerans TaxID=90970 RepID=A0ABT9LSD7_9BACL|nr:coproporphyrinogen dehydrogenase HemZ [Alicyclobacillus tengchongensis]MDP9727175.1 oxygen-independent coproporphyrinogen-3 oxidase [Alicyclobacillus tengchongensis]
MKVWLARQEDIGQELIERCIHRFLPLAEIQLCTLRHSIEERFIEGDWLLSLSSQMENQLIHIQGSLFGAENKIQKEIRCSLPAHLQTKDKEKKIKRAYLLLVYRLLEEGLQHSLPWGILEGIRPIKIVHQLLQQEWDTQRIVNQLQDDYGVSSSRAQLAVEVAQRELAVVPDLYRLSGEVSLYIGIPFCPTHCAYCTFPAYSMADKAYYVNDFLAAMQKELKAIANLLKEYRIPVTTVYLGGGTPTSLRALELEKLLDSIRRWIPGYGQWREFTVEAGRPDTITPDRLRVLRQYGVNRISINPQTYREQTLRLIQRGHTPHMVDHRFYAAREAGFDNINMDLILGLPSETLADVQYTLERTLALQPEAITVHALAFKRSAEVREEKEKYSIPTDSVVQEMMNEAMHSLRQAAYHPYYLYRQRDILGHIENVGMARAGKESPYNVLIMEEKQTILGIGGGAVSKWVRPSDGKVTGRFANPRDPHTYVQTIDEVIARKLTQFRKIWDMNTHHSAAAFASSINNDM